MTLVVETGAGDPDAESYLSVEDFDSYCANIGYVTNADVTTKEQALRRGTRYIDGRYRLIFTGQEAVVGQALCWPRLGAVRDGRYTILSNFIPKQLRDATAEAAWRELTSSLSPDITLGEAMVTEETVGPLTVTYQASSNAKDYRPVVVVIDELMSSLVGSTRYTGRAMRG